MTMLDDRDQLLLATLRELAAKKAEIKWLRDAAERVCRFDWSSNDNDAVAAVDDLRRALNGHQ